ncbi:MAG: UDP-N-acetylglucosamine 1-carboxyvinyltransferase [Bacteroidales bacterium]|jgi:UDP-N-acetylglucosamine 1-carboxyvinyltransferase|nr:UDP-N-acetylglucosamine 1-carboxyvinyltransferase [Bacteroidales bacterium]
MSSFLIHGGKCLSGEIVPQGAKNEALQVLCAVLLTKDEVKIGNIPNIRDVNKLIEILTFLGVKIRPDINSKKADAYIFQADEIALEKIYTQEYATLCSQLRGSIMLSGALIARFGKSVVYSVGGDKIGRRRIDTHFTGFEKLGVKIDYSTEQNAFLLKSNGLKGDYILLDEASVTGTANIIMVSVMAKGKTTIFNAACEPYVVQLCRMLNAMGANISGVGSNLLTIEGVETLHGCTHCLLPDMIEVGSFIGLAAITASSLTIKDVNYEQLGIIPEVFRRLGIKIERKGDDIFVHQQSIYEVERFKDGSIMTVSDAPWPGFTPDLISIVLVVATQAEGSVLIHQKMFESRLFFVDKLIDMGAQIILCDPHRATVIGSARRYPLRGVRMTSPDIRAGVALLWAALCAKGESIIDNIEQIDRGYQNIDLRLAALGADIKRI